MKVLEEHIGTRGRIKQPSNCPQCDSKVRGVVTNPIDSMSVLITFKCNSVLEWRSVLANNKFDEYLLENSPCKGTIERGYI